MVLAGEPRRQLRPGGQMEEMAKVGGVLVGIGIDNQAKQQGAGELNTTTSSGTGGAGSLGRF
jgi:hypothetical protein